LLTIVEVIPLVTQIMGKPYVMIPRQKLSDGLPSIAVR
jgi:hypothetical protein